MGEEVVWGLRPVEEALESGVSVQTLYVAKGGGRRFEGLVSMARRRGAKVVEVPREVLDRYSPRHQGVVLVISPVVFVSWQEVLEEVKGRGEVALMLALDGVEDAGNVGAIIRSAEALGVHCLLLSRRRAASITPAVVKSSAGAAFHLPISRVTNLARTLREMKGLGMWVVGTHLGEGVEPWRADFTLPVVLVVGNEERGMSRLVRESCDFLVKIPMRGRVASLNVSAATAVLLYEILRQRWEGSL